MNLFAQKHRDSYEFVEEWFPDYQYLGSNISNSNRNDLKLSNLSTNKLSLNPSGPFNSSYYSPSPNSPLNTNNPIGYSESNPELPSDNFYQKGISFFLLHFSTLCF
ncbi:hypothetical protein AYI69_g3925 [Smittium culicis]|uniref:Uncharacterized protein n=1 Tax=Smittium culicis TaxID=133412 RepID=A0A1R1XPE6_9FUNG|nr:hypothetical protein AYI69_g7827 [Smittium culicis]OMJ26669.1 hypothetical protein AYI69_g3925 [Smittium culicis]